MLALQKVYVFFFFFFLGGGGGGGSQCKRQIRRYRLSFKMNEYTFTGSNSVIFFEPPFSVNCYRKDFHSIAVDSF